jgi:WD40 repeat protein
MALGEPDAGKPLVRFDEGRSQTVIGLGPLQPVGSAYSTEGESRKTFDDAHRSWVNTIVRSSDGRFVASASADGTTQIWDAVQERWLRTLAPRGNPNSLKTYTDRGYELSRRYDVSASFTSDSRAVLTDHPMTFATGNAPATCQTLLQAAAA